MTDLKIMSHARRRYVERIRQPEHYKHLTICKKYCNECSKLESDLDCVVTNFGRKIDFEIASIYRKCKENNQVIKDSLFLDTVKALNKYKPNRIYYIDKNTIFVVVQTEIPTLVTVLSKDMIDGTIILKNPNVNHVFKTWKSRLDKKREIKQL